MDFTKIKTKFVNTQIKDREYNKSQYIADLMFMEDMISNPRKGMGINIKYHHLKSKYEKEYLAILKELDLVGYQQKIKEIKREKEQNQQLEKKEQYKEELEEQESKETWKKMGGKL
jgi:hypothetical protein